MSQGMPKIAGNPPTVFRGSTSSFFDLEISILFFITSMLDFSKFRS